MKSIDTHELAGVVGGMRWEQFRPSTNVEDRRGMSLRESMRVREPLPPPLPPLHRYPNDLPHQLGLDDIDGYVRRLRRQHRR